MIALDRVQAALPALSPAERRVGKLCLGNPQKFAKLPVSRLADLCHVSNPTVVRFCRSVGYSGLQDFKLTLASEMEQGVPFIHPKVHRDDRATEVASKCIGGVVATLLKHGDDANFCNVDVAVDALVEANRRKKRIVFFGVGNSGLVAQDAQLKFFRLGTNTVAYVDGHTQAMSASMLESGDCVVAISNSGRSRDLMDACNIARARGATTIVITASGSPLAALGCIHLIADHTEAFDMYSPMVSRLLHLVIVDILVTCTALRIGGPKVQPILEGMKLSLQGKRYG